MIKRISSQEYFSKCDLAKPFALKYPRALLTLLTYSDLPFAYHYHCFIKVNGNCNSLQKQILPILQMHHK